MRRKSLLNSLFDRLSITPSSPSMMRQNGEQTQEEGSPNPRAAVSQVSSPALSSTHYETSFKDPNRLPHLPNEIWELIFSSLNPIFLCKVVSIVSKDWKRICYSNVVWKNQCIQNLGFGSDITLEPGMTSWKDQFQHWSQDIWDVNNKYQTIFLENKNKTAIGKYEAWRTVIGKLAHGKGKRIWQLVVEESTYIIGIGICHSKANVSVDLSGSSPAISYFSNGYTYSYPNTISSSLEPTRSHKTQTYGKGDVITIALDQRGICSFFRNETRVVYFILLPTELCQIAWHVAATLSNGAKVTLKTIFDSTNYFTATEPICPITKKL